MSSDIITVGLHISGITSSCAIIRNGELLFASCEERYSRVKFDKFFPQKSLEAGLSKFKIGINEIQKFAISWNPGINIKDKFRPGFSEWPAYPGARLYSIPNKILPLFGDIPDLGTTELNFTYGNGSIDFEYINHHEAHASFCYYASGFKEADVLVNDGYGEKASTSFYKGSFSNLRLVHQDFFPNSIGMLYSTITQFLGFRPNFDEWKVMGASAYGRSDAYQNEFNKLASLSSGKTHLDLSYFKYYDFDNKYLFSERLTELLGKPRDPCEQLNQRHFDIAASLQKFTEILVIEQLKVLRETSSTENLCLSGGVAMNCLLNGAIQKQNLYKNIYIPYAPDDSGNAIGAALISQIKNYEYIGTNLNNPYTGDSFSNDEIIACLNRFQIKYEHSSSIERDAASFIYNGKIIGWFQDSMEFGQRSLGNRSILADPRDPLMKEKINSAIKFREGFRPFAPSVLEEYACDWFEMGNLKSIPYMEKILPIKKYLSDKVPSICHADGSARLQTVTKSSNPRFYKLISEFNLISNIPMIINTSFNTNNEPIVRTPEDAIRTFYTSGLDILILGDFIIKK